MEEKQTHEFTIKEPWFTLIQRRIKGVEGRLNKGNFAKLNVGDEVTWTKNLKQKDGTEKKYAVKTEILKITKYNNFEDMLKAETLKRTLPGIPSVNCGVEVYRQFYKQEDEEKYGVLGIQLKTIDGKAPQLMRGRGRKRNSRR